MCNIFLKKTKTDSLKECDIHAVDKYWSIRICKLCPQDVYNLTGGIRPKIEKLVKMQSNGISTVWDNIQRLK